MTTRHKNKFDAKDKLNLSYVYWLLNEVSLCTHENNFSSFEISKLIPKLEDVLNHVCDDSGRY